MTYKPTGAGKGSYYKGKPKLSPEQHKQVELIILNLLNLYGEMRAITLFEHAQHYMLCKRILRGVFWKVCGPLYIKGLINTHTVARPPSKGGRPMRFFSITEAGERFLDANKAIDEI